MLSRRLRTETLGFREFLPLPHERSTPAPLFRRLSTVILIAQERQQQQLAVAEEAERKANGNAMTERRAAYEKAKEAALALAREQVRVICGRISLGLACSRCSRACEA